METVSYLPQKQTREERQREQIQLQQEEIQKQSEAVLALMEDQ
mgnify:CR=1 FL=1|tara:strand:- start:846 stop:974 length:129 start_codon:yes stop_codon:yes gene_type:complete